MFHRKTKRSVTQEKAEWERDKEVLEMDYALKEEKRAFRKAHAPKANSTKIYTWFLFVNFTLIEVFTGYCTLRSFRIAEMYGSSPDLTALITLIGAVIGETLTFIAYAVKSAKENSRNGIVYEMAMRDRDDSNK